MNVRKAVYRLAIIQFIASMLLPVGHLAAKPVPSIADYLDDLRNQEAGSEWTSRLFMMPTST